MPELPDVEAARRLIAGEALERPIAAVDHIDPYVCRPHSAGELRAALTGRRLTAARRRGKSMWCETSGAGRSREPGPDLGIHLGMTGRIVVTSPGGHADEGGRIQRLEGQANEAKWNRFTLEFADGGSLVLFDTRRFGRIRLNPDIDELGPDAQEVTLAQFRGLLAKGTIAVKARLLDQSKIAGIGNLLADEALWEARLPPMAPVSTLERADVDRLYRALQSDLKSSVAHGQVTGAILTARHAGAMCPRGDAQMDHGTVGGRSTWWCSREQAPRSGMEAVASS
jgi:formamidopyrimidine-DNA glycosylase